MEIGRCTTKFFVCSRRHGIGYDMHSEPLIRGIIFDMDGVLCDSEPFICEAACRMFAERHGVPVQAEDFVPFVGAGEDRYLGGVAAKHGISLVLPADKDRTYAIYLDIIRGRLKPLAGVTEFVVDCRRRGLKLAVATSADLIKMRGNLREIQLSVNTFDACVNGSEIERKKPDPEIFLSAAHKLALSPSRCLVVEDAPNGIQAAIAAGMRALGITTSFEPEMLKKAGANWVACDLAHVPADIFELCEQ